MTLRERTPFLVAPILRITGFRFSKHYRWGSTRFHRIVYAICPTTMCNLVADGCEYPHA